MTDSDPTQLRANAHLAFGWWSLAVFILLGTALEVLHGFKIGFYLDVSNESRRLLWTLSHAHGTLLALVHIAFALSLPRLPEQTIVAQRLASRCLYVGAIALPAGFFLGGLFARDGDPGLPVVLVPIGALALLLAAVLVGWSLRRR